jgi:hypothetical protein
MYEYVDIRGTYVWRRYTGGIQDSTGTNFGGTSNWTNEKPDRSRNPKPKGPWLSPTGYNRRSSVIRYPIGECFVKTDMSGNYTQKDVGVLSVSHCGSTTGLFSDSEKNFFKGRAEIKALKALKTQKFNAGVALAEARETGELIGSTAKRIATAVSQLQNGQYKRAAKSLGVHPRVAPRSWLELQYGWKPLLQDVHGAAQHLAEQTNQPHLWRVTTRGTHKVKSKTNRVIDLTYRAAKEEKETLESCFVRLDFQPWRTFLTAAANSGLLNPAEVLWEKLPFSFVFDWFLPVGDWLGTLDATIGYDFMSGSWSYLRRSNIVRKAGYTPLTLKHEWSNDYNERHFALERVPYSTEPSPFQGRMFPKFKDPFSLTHVANGLSLLASAFDRDPPKIRR